MPRIKENSTMITFTALFAVCFVLCGCMAEKSARLDPNEALLHVISQATLQQTLKSIQQPTALPQKCEPEKKKAFSCDELLILQERKCGGFKQELKPIPYKQQHENVFDINVG